MVSIKKRILPSAINVLKTVSRFCIELKDTFSNAITFTLIKKYVKGSVDPIATVFGPL